MAPLALGNKEGYKESQHEFSWWVCIQATHLHELCLRLHMMEDSLVDKFVLLLLIRSAA